MNFTGLVDEIYSRPDLYFSGFEKLKERRITNRDNYLAYLRHVHQDTDSIYSFALIISQEIEP